MVNLKNIALAAGLLFSATAANAVILDFNSMAEASGSHGESAWNPLTFSFGDFSLSITGFATDDDDSVQYAYLDANNGGLGTCKDLLSTATANVTTNSTANLCDPGSDDNITTNEGLSAVFTEDVIIENLWFNNNHDGGFDAGDQINIDGTLFDVTTGYAGDSNGIGSFTVAAGYSFDISFFNEQFYLSAMEVRSAAVPEPSITMLLGIGFLIFGFARHKRSQTLQA